MDCSRRVFLSVLGGVAAGSVITHVANQNLVIAAPAASTAPQGGKNGHFAQVNGEFGWKPQKLDPAVCAPVAYDGYWYKGYACGYGSFYSIIGMLGEQYGEPYNQFPFSMLEANKGGISDWGTICGALYGAVAAFALFWPRKEREAMVDELFRWYEVTALPMYNPGDAAQGVKGDIPSNVSGSVLCHISVSKWAEETGLGANSKERSERCGRLTADVATKAIEIFNNKIESGADFMGTIPPQESVAKCSTCHTKSKKDNLKGKMDCTPCHSGNDHTQNKFMNHPPKKQ